MKEINKISIDQDHVISDNELLNLKGGVVYPTFTCDVNCEGQGSTLTFSSMCDPGDTLCAYIQCWIWLTQNPGSCPTGNCLDCHSGGPV